MQTEQYVYTVISQQMETMGRFSRIDSEVVGEVPVMQSRVLDTRHEAYDAYSGAGTRFYLIDTLLPKKFDVGHNPSPMF
jgi:hypothetical protein